MPSLRQLRANRENARKSTGPRTPEGKQRSKMNGCKHGLTAATIVMTNEDEADFDSLRETLAKEYEAVGELELQCVDRVARHYFRMLRSARVEPAMFESRMLEVFYEQIGGPQNIKPEMVNDPTFDIDRGIAACYTRFGKDVDLHRRYEVTIERQYYSALDQLERLQNKRARREQRAQRENLAYRQNSGRKTTVATTAAAASLEADLDTRSATPRVNLTVADVERMCEPPSPSVQKFAPEQPAAPCNAKSGVNPAHQSLAPKSTPSLQCRPAESNTNSTTPTNPVVAPATETQSAALKYSSAKFAKSSSEKSDGNLSGETVPVGDATRSPNKPVIAEDAAKHPAEPSLTQPKAAEYTPLNPIGFGS